MVCAISIALACLISTAVGAPAELDARTLSVERAIAAGPVVEDRGLANLFHSNPYTNGPTAQLTAEQKSAWTTLAHYTAAVYCKPEDVKAWDCGTHCSSVPKPKVITFGGDNGATPYFYVANDGHTVYVSIAGTNTKNPLSLANDINFFPRRVSTKYFPDSSGTEVHSGFYGAFTRVAGPIAKAVNSQVAGGTKQVIVLGHSLGAAVGELTATYLARILGPSVTVQARLIASPRVGNVPWSKYVDKSFGDRHSYLVNFNDPIPHLPPKDWGFRHASNEIYIPAVGSPEMIACSGAENKKCSGQFNDPLDFITSMKDWMTSEVHNGPFAGVLMGTVLDRSATPPATDAASYDYNKIVRQEYSDPLYARLAHDAMDLWRTPEWRDFYHETGVVVAVSRSAQQSEYISRALAVNALPGMQTPDLDARILGTRDEVQAVYPPDAPLGDFASQNVYINYAGGWANPRGATESANARARTLGVRYRAGTAKELIVDESGKILGVVTQENEEWVTADVTILCMGAWTPLLVPELKNECLPTGQVVGAIQLTPEELKRYKDVPVTRMIDNGFYIFPPTSQGVVKFAIHQKGYLNPRDGLSSVPRTALTRGYENQRVPENAHKALLAGLKRVYPELAAKEWLTSRLCWYSDRPSGDWLIDYHPAYKNLFIAAGCCGHAFKFLPILGRLIVQGINRQLPTELADVWAFHHRVEGRKDESRSFSVYHRLDVPANVSRL